MSTEISPSEITPRERYEDAEMTPVTVHPAIAWAILVAALSMIFAVPTWRQLTAGHGEVATAAVGTLGDAPTLLERNRQLLGRIDAVESALENGSKLRAAVLPDAQWALLRFGGVGNETVYAAGASPEWLVLRSGFDHVTGPPFLDADVLERRRRLPSAPEPDPRPAILDLHRQLEARGVRLVFLPVPTKPAVLPEALGARRSGEPMARNPSLEILLRTLEEAGVHVVDPGPILADLEAQPAYLRTDSHWSPAAVDTVAAALAAELEALARSERFELGPENRDWIRTATERRGRGDLWRALSLPAERPLLAEESVEAEDVTSWDGYFWEPARGAPVMLLGDSFSTVYSDESLHWGRGAGLAEQLAYHLGRDVDRLARPDGSSDQVRRDLARQPERLEATRVLVYQVATRELSLGDWPLVELSDREGP